MKFLIFLWQKKFIQFLSYFFITILIIWITMAIIPPKRVIEENPFITTKEKGPMIVAHQGGNLINPGNTFLAFDYAIDNYNIEVLELDLCMTKDNRLVAIHDLTINGTTDVIEIMKEEKDYFVRDFTLDDLLVFNFGYHFIDLNGNRPYQSLVTPEQIDRKEAIKNAKLQIATIDEIFEAYYQSDLMFIVEIKDRGELGMMAADYLNNLINDNEKYPNANLIRRVVIGTFHTEIERYLKESYSNLMRGGSVGEVTKFVLTQMFGVNIFDNSSFVCLQIPTSQRAYGLHFKLDQKTYIRRAHRRNIAVQYWTINDEETMRRLINMGVDAIMTDRPDLLYHVLKDMGYRN